MLRSWSRGKGLGSKFQDQDLDLIQWQDYGKYTYVTTTTFI